MEALICRGLFAHDMYSLVKSFMTKLLLFSCQIGNKQFTHFPTLQQITISDQNLERYTSLLLALHAEFSHHFEDFRMIENDMASISSPFTCDVDNAPSDLQLEAFKSAPLPRFYSSLNEQNFPKIKAHAQKMLVRFRSTYVCEQPFSVRKFNISKNRSSISDNHLAAVLRIATTEMTPDFTSLVNAHQRFSSSH
uniref:HAT C-terminal dimerisation domain-containing protein n=1 Tax=Chelydra serpentina TaxID=8475 RepID=A0A8C3S936_CHESE